MRFGIVSATRSIGKEAGDGGADNDGARRRGQARASLRVDRDGFERIAPLLPGQRRGGKWAVHRTVPSGMFWVLNTGAQWRDMPERYGKWETVYGRYRRWTRKGLFDRLLTQLHVSLEEVGHID